MERFTSSITADGSHTLFDAQWGETFKSRHAAGLESQEVFIRPGVLENPRFREERTFHILEMGLGLATNCRACLATVSNKTSFIYTAIEADLAGLETLLSTNQIETSNHSWIQTLLREGKAMPRPGFEVRLINEKFIPALDALPGPFDAIFHDPFSPARNPEGWTEEIAKKLFQVLSPNGRLVTYSVSRIAKEIFSKAGFEMTKLRLPELLHKRESLLAIKSGEPS
jgi:tRNA U34 5-methylaminomethyl-2-thiouridine-forming methyltransferase MnmC